MKNLAATRNPELECLIGRQEVMSRWKVSALSHRVRIWGPQYLNDEIHQAESSLKASEDPKEEFLRQEALLRLLQREIDQQLCKTLGRVNDLRTDFTDTDFDRQRFHFRESTARWLLHFGLNNVLRDEPSVLPRQLATLEMLLQSRATAIDVPQHRKMQARTYGVVDPPKSREIRARAIEILQTTPVYLNSEVDDLWGEKD